ncbi:hypothetical protein [Granulicella sibirica]|uniref:hypothetical protein n=1 Tax=Granulicella sibirica TaxID=2479048 RepID=UPI001008B374|nr:hypothetical protein [Granulicella sibirica]
MEKPTFYEPVNGVKDCSLFFLHRIFALVVVLGIVALHRVSIRTSDELSSCKLGARSGARGESMLPFIGSLEGQTGSQSSEHGVVATGEHVDHSSS